MPTRMIYPLLAAIFLLTACSRSTPEADFTPTESTLYLTSEGTITSATVETYDPATTTYDESAFRAYVTTALEAFNGPSGAIPADGSKADLPATLTACTLSDGTATLLITFKDPATYQSFQSAYPDEESEIRIETITISPVAEAADTELDGTTFLSSKDNTQVSVDTIKKKSTLTIARIEGAASITTDAPIQYVSENVTLTGDCTARVSSDAPSYIIFK